MFFHFDCEALDSETLGLDVFTTMIKKGTDIQDSWPLIASQCIIQHKMISSLKCLLFYRHMENLCFLR